MAYYWKIPCAAPTCPVRGVVGDYNIIDWCIRPQCGLTCMRMHHAWMIIGTGWYPKLGIIIGNNLSTSLLLLVKGRVLKNGRLKLTLMRALPAQYV